MTTTTRSAFVPPQEERIAEPTDFSRHRKRSDPNLQQFHRYEVMNSPSIWRQAVNTRICLGRAQAGMVAVAPLEAVPVSIVAPREAEGLPGKRLEHENFVYSNSLSVHCVRLYMDSVLMCLYYEAEQLCSCKCENHASKCSLTGYRPTRALRGQRVVPGNSAK